MSRRMNELVEQVLDASEREQRYAFASTSRGRNACARRQKAGSLISPWKGLYCRASYFESLDALQKDLHLIRSLALKQPSVVFAGPSAAVAHGLWVPRVLRGAVHMVTSRRAHTASRRLTKRLIVDGDGICRPLGIPCTSLERTLFDCLRSCSLRDGLQIADSALRIPGVSHDALIGRFDEMRSGFRGAPQARRTLICADARSGSPGESALRARLIELGYQLPELQVSVEDPLCPGRTYEIDMGYPMGGGWLFIEFDGEAKRGDDMSSIRRSLSRERKRESRLTLLRHPILRIGWEDLADDARLRGLLDAFGAPRA